MPELSCALEGVTDPSLLETTSRSRGQTDIVCPGDASSSDSCYLYRQDQQTWEVARDTCDELGGYLVAIETPSELSTIREGVLPLSYHTNTTFPAVWTGLNDRSSEGVYTWERPVELVHFFPSHPYSPLSEAPRDT
ncbi:snaclec salmorin subunit A-like [Diadema antillarum]|uniref:snaclec salmorin subunit A-like n=1 Tax=Diadema antillarum TaxID=105358 RepID=UPI003A8C5643